jgi:methyl-accepting chemotaxis protein
MRLSTKLFLGFSLVAAICLALVGWALYVMRGVGQEARVLSNQYMPQTQMANRMERSLLKAMVDMQGYQLSFDKAYLASSRKNLEEMKGQLDEAKKLVTRYPQLETLKNNTAKSLKSLTEYEELVRETEKAVGDIHKIRATLEASAQDFLKICSEFAEDQLDKLNKDFQAGASQNILKDLLDAFSGINDVISLDYVIQLDTARSQLLRDPKILSEAMSKFTEMENQLSSIQKKTTDTTNIGQLDDIRMTAADYKSQMGKMLATFQKLSELEKQRQIAENSVLQAAKVSATTGIDEAGKRAGQVEQILARSIFLLFVGICIGAILSLGLSVFVTRSITRPLAGYIDNLKESAVEVTQASDKLSAESQTIAEGATQQAAALEETSSSLEEMASMSRQNADNASQANVLSGEAAKTLHNAGSTIENLINAMQGVSKASEDTAKILKSIDEIAFQTNLLALNAAVEAACAGEAGAGFAVVAGEVRNLAQRAAQSAKDTAVLIEDTLVKVKLGSNLVLETSENFSALSTSTEKVINLVAEISGASEEQAQGAQQINKAITEVDKVVQQNAANAQEGAGASQLLKVQANQLSAVVLGLLSMVNGVRHQEAEAEEFEG